MTISILAATAAAATVSDEDVPVVRFRDALVRRWQDSQRRRHQSDRSSVRSSAATSVLDRRLGVDR
jgi:hypothetical protein